MKKHIVKVDKGNFRESRAICTKAFGRTIDIHPNIEATEKVYFHDPINRMQQYWKDALLWYQDDTPVAHVAQGVFPVSFNGRVERMVGIGEVACIVKGTNAIPELFAEVLLQRDLEGVAFSYLYPFSGRYYARYGYSYGVKRYAYSVSEGALPKTSGRVLRYEAGDYYQIEAIHAREAEGYSLAVVRDALDWKGLLEHPRNTTYVSWEGEKNIQAYAVLTADTEQEGVFVDCGGFASGLFAIASYIFGEKGYKSLTFTRPLEFGLGEYFDEWHRYPIQETVQRAGMVRIVNLEAALHAHSAGKSDESIIVSLSDPCIPRNNGVFCYDSKTRSVKNSNEKPQLQLSINELSYLVCIGCDDHSISIMFPEIPKNMRNKLLSMFPKQKVTVFDGF